MRAFAWWRIGLVFTDTGWGGPIVEVLIVYGFVLLVVGLFVAVVAFGLGLRGAALLAGGAIAALWVDPRAVVPERDLTNDGTMVWWRLPTGPIRTAVEEYAPRAGIEPP